MAATPRESGGTLTLDIGDVHVNVSGGDDPQRAGREAADAFVRRLRTLIREDPSIRHELEMVMRDKS